MHSFITDLTITANIIIKRVEQDHGQRVDSTLPGLLMQVSVGLEIPESRPLILLSLIQHHPIVGGDIALSSNIGPAQRRALDRALPLTLPAPQHRGW